MTDLSQLSNEELDALIAERGLSAPEGPKQEPLGLLKRAGFYLPMTAPAMTAIFGTDELKRAFTEPVTQQEAIGGLRELAQESTGFAGSLTGAKLGGAAGAFGGPFAPVTAPAGAVLGGALGYVAGKLPTQLGLDYFLGDETPVEQRVLDAVGTAETGALLETGLRGLGAAGNLVAPLAKKASQGLLRTSLGARATDYGKANKGYFVEPIKGDFGTKLKQSLDSIIDDGTVGATRNPQKLWDRVTKAEEVVEGKIQQAIRAVDESDVTLKMPSFQNAERYLKNNRVNVTEIPSYRKIIEDFKDAIKNESKFVEPDLPTLYDEFGRVIPKDDLPGMQRAVEAFRADNASRSRLSLDVLNKQKKIFGEKYKDGPQSDPGFWRAFYRDLQTHIERYAPEVKKLNQEKQRYVLAKPIIARDLFGAEAMYRVGNAQRLLNTTGGAGLAGGALLGQALGLPTGTGQIAALGLRSLATRKGDQLIGNLLGAPADLVMSKPVQAAIEYGPQALSSAVRALMPEDASPPLDLEYSFSSVDSPENQTPDDLSQISDEELNALLAARGLMGMDEPQQVQVEEAPATKQDVSSLIESQPPLIKAIVMTESGGDPKAKSKVGAGGLMQLMPATAKDLGVTDPFDPRQNIEGGTKYVTQLLKRYDGNKMKALAAYNWGMGNLDKAMRKANVDTWPALVRKLGTRSKSNPGGIPKETIDYVRKVMQKEKEYMVEV